MSTMKTYDKRTMDRYIEKGIVKKQDVESLLKSLPDESANADWVEVEMESQEFDNEEMSDSANGTGESV